ncbi:hypothetical protein B7494_g3437 [Chlorociboria aeruginascens]|nr:hypothetical protein B7494_g3437 [Chlorociboria aeruginascens]
MPATLPISRPEQAYAANENDAERAFPLQELEPTSSIMNHGSPGQVPRDAVQNSEGPTIGNETRTSTATESHGTSQGDAGHASSTASTWRDSPLFGLFRRNPFSRRTSEDAWNKDGRYDKLKYEKVSDHPRGIGQLAMFMNSDKTFAVNRMFGQLSARMLLLKQVELTIMEEKLHKLDHADAADPTLKGRLVGAENYIGWTSEQQDLIACIQPKLYEYHKCLWQDMKFRSRGRAPTRNHSGLFDWMWNNKPIIEDKFSFIYHADDFVSPIDYSKKRNLIEDWIESFLDRWPNFPIMSFLQTKTERDNSEDEQVDYYSPSRLSLLAKTLLVVAVVTVLHTPVFLLFLVEMSRMAMAWTSLVFVTAFCITISAVTDRIQEVFLASTGYFAVLVVFLSNVNQGAFCAKAA